MNTSECEMREPKCFFESRRLEAARDILVVNMIQHTFVAPQSACPREEFALLLTKCLPEEFWPTLRSYTRSLFN